MHRSFIMVIFLILSHSFVSLHWFPLVNHLSSMKKKIPISCHILIY
uniref:Uncharacterized protein n=1 Tax=Rhizophora mucronata TaxID=61149 RepID=A0A2P2Q016_RHIMU